MCRILHAAIRETFSVFIAPFQEKLGRSPEHLSFHPFLSSGDE